MEKRQADVDALTMGNNSNSISLIAHGYGEDDCDSDKTDEDTIESEEKSKEIAIRPAKMEGNADSDKGTTEQSKAR